ncbi:Glucosaminyl phosphatidylinositol (GlcN-PI) nositol acylation protein [Xylographa opegraphella]|nr:Glucosaminyl phosphatidylinositol (GlcN-PI) nositol acylation protein [Xylographa opegraphella]
MAQSYKALKEDFVSNLTGGSASEINLVTAVAPAAVLLWSVLQSRQGFFSSYGGLAFVVDFLLNVVAILLATTLYSEAPLVLNVLLLAPAVVLYASQSARSPQSRAVKVNETRAEKSVTVKLDTLPVRPFITAYRGSMMIITCIAIIAVDFQIFPRRFAKVENWGTSLMDIGVGSFVFSAGVVAARPILKNHLAGRSLGFATRLYASVKHSLPLFVLGVVRLYTVKGLDYAEHVSEYGVHWNFFFTLALLPPFVAGFQSFFKLIPSYAVLALLLGSAYQALLELTSLKGYVLTAPRTDIISKNREGIFSFFGYLAIFLAGQATGLYVLPRSSPMTKSSGNAGKERRRLLVTLASWTLIWNCLLAFTLSYNYGLALRVSRRLANLPYVLWVCAFNCAHILAFCLIETCVFPNVYRAMDRATERREADFATSRVLHCYNRNGLAIFLLANLMTGLINLTVKTIVVNTGTAMAILLGYAMMVTTIAIALDVNGISVKI